MEDFATTVLGTPTQDLFHQPKMMDLTSPQMDKMKFLQSINNQQ
jgi:hypothetical protein